MNADDQFELLLRTNFGEERYPEFQERTRFNLFATKIGISVLSYSLRLVDNELKALISSLEDAMRKNEFTDSKQLNLAFISALESEF